MTKTKSIRMTLCAVMGACSLLAPLTASADELLSGPYNFDAVTSVHAKPAMLGEGWGQTVGASFETVINGAVTAGFEADIDVPMVPYPGDPSSTISQFYGGLRLGAIFASSSTLHGWVNNTLGVGLLGDQTFLIDEVSAAAEVNVTRAIRTFAGVGYRYVRGINADRGLNDANVRGLFFDVGIRYGEIGR